MDPRGIGPVPGFSLRQYWGTGSRWSGRKSASASPLAAVSAHLLQSVQELISSHSPPRFLTLACWGARMGCLDDFVRQARCVGEYRVL
jgi:hypothetical protein